MTEDEHTVLVGLLAVLVQRQGGGNAVVIRPSDLEQVYGLQLQANCEDDGSTTVQVVPKKDAIQ